MKLANGLSEHLRRAGYFQNVILSEAKDLCITKQHKSNT
jgi:hypothetical protein